MSVSAEKKIKTPTEFIKLLCINFGKQSSGDEGVYIFLFFEAWFDVFHNELYLQTLTHIF